MFLRKGFYDEAVVLLNKAIKGEKNEKGLYINRGGICLKKNVTNDYTDCSRVTIMNKINVNKTLCTLYVQLNQYSYGKCIFTRFVYL